MFTYDSSLQKDKDVVRFLLQDTNSTRPLLQDEEIYWLLKNEANVYSAAAACAETLVTRFQAVSSKSVGGLSISYGGVETWRALASKLRVRGSTHQVPSAGGISLADRDALWEDTDLIQPTFYDKMLQDPLERSGSDMKSDEELP